LNEQELEQMLNLVCAILVGAARAMWDQAIAEGVEREMLGITSSAQETLRAARERQAHLPDLAIGANEAWIMWVADTRDNWSWMMQKYDALLHRYQSTYGKEPPGEHKRIVRHLWLGGPRPRRAGITPFPEETC
jgi:hypothetical protein